MFGNMPEPIETFLERVVVEFSSMTPRGYGMAEYDTHLFSADRNLYNVGMLSLVSERT